MDQVGGMAKNARQEYLEMLVFVQKDQAVFLQTPASPVMCLTVSFAVQSSTPFATTLFVTPLGNIIMDMFS